MWKIELLEATRVDSPIARFIEKRGEGIHHIAFDVKDAQETVNELAEFHPLNATTKAGLMIKWLPSCIRNLPTGFWLKCAAIRNKKYQTKI